MRCTFSWGEVRLNKKIPRIRLINTDTFDYSIKMTAVIRAMLIILLGSVLEPQKKKADDGIIYLVRFLRGPVRSSFHLLSPWLRYLPRVTLRRALQLSVESRIISNTSSPA